MSRQGGLLLRVNRNIIHIIMPVVVLLIPGFWLELVKSEIDCFYVMKLFFKKMFIIFSIVKRLFHKKSSSQLELRLPKSVLKR
jgi:hypothetical protein